MGNWVVEMISALMTTSKTIGQDIILLDCQIANVYFLGDERNYILIDTGLNNTRHYIKKIIKNKFNNHIPKAIILTHGHFDHVGSVKYFAQEWKIPVYAHVEEIPYLTGQKNYPEGNPKASKGLVAKISKMFPHTTIKVDGINPLPPDGTIPYLQEWRYIHTPGHTPGHIALFRDKDRVLISGDAIITTKQELLSSVLTHKEEISEPPKYFTFDFDKAKQSIYKLQQLHPYLLLPSHGKPLNGEKLVEHLNFLIEKITEK